MTDVFYPMIVRAMDEDDGGGFAALVLDLPGCMGDGATAAEAVAHAQEAVLEWIDEAVRLGRDVPVPGSSISRVMRQNSGISDTLKKQQELIQSQEDLIEALQRTVDSQRVQIEELCAGGQPYEAAWANFLQGGDLPNLRLPAAILSQREKDLQH